MHRDSVEPTVDRLPGERAAEWVEYHHEHDAPAIGPFCTDVDGNVLLD